jgi:hypothetical protein
LGRKKNQARETWTRPGHFIYCHHHELDWLV